MALLELSARQHGLAHRSQFAEHGLTDDAVRHLVESGRWEWRGNTVLRLVGSPATPEQRALAAVLDLAPGAAISNESAAARWGLPGFSLEPLHVTGTRERGRQRNHLATVHQPRVFLPDHILLLDAVPTTSPTLTLFALAGTLHPKRMERTLDNALAMGLTTTARCHGMLGRLQRKGRSGIVLMRTLLDVRGADYRPPATGLEARFQDLARQAGITSFERQLDLGDDERWIGRVDFVERRRLVIVEVQSDRFHAALLDRERDEARRAALTAAGWRVLEVREFDVWHRPDTVIRRLQALFW